MLEFLTPPEEKVFFNSDYSQINDPLPVAIHWKKVAKNFLISREIDRIETEFLVPKRKVFNQFSATGHELAQIILGQFLNHPKDAVCGYYRSRPLALSLGVPLDDVVAAPLAKAGSFSNGRDVGVVFNFPNTKGAKILPTHGGVGAQYTPVAGWAKALVYYRDVIGDPQYRGAVAVACGGDGSVAANGFWSAINIAATLNLPQLFFIEDNGLGISVSSEKQTPGGNITRNLSSFGNLNTAEIDGTDPMQLEQNLSSIFTNMRGENPSPWIVRIKVPRICGHTCQDHQAYRDPTALAEAERNDPLETLRIFISEKFSNNSSMVWETLVNEACVEVAQAYQRAEQRQDPDPALVGSHIFSSRQTELKSGSVVMPDHQQKITMLGAIRKTLATELARDSRVIVFGEDVGLMGGVHAATLGLQQEFGENRVFDTSLSEEGIIGSAVGMAYAGLKAVPEIQFRKYADSAVEQLRDCGTVRWRTHNRFSAPIVVRMPVGYGKRGDLWHAETNEAEWIHSIGWKVAYPSNAEDAAGLLRYAIQADDPAFIFEHRHLLDSSWAKRHWPGDNYLLPFGSAKRVSEGDCLTVISWGACVEECDLAVTAHFKQQVELIDLRSLKPWDLPLCAESVKKTGKCLIVHEDYEHAGFGAEIAASIQRECFYDLDAPIARLAKPNIPCPHQKHLLDITVPKAPAIAAAIEELLKV